MIGFLAIQCKVQGQAMRLVHREYDATVDTNVLQRAEQNNREPLVTLLQP